MSIDGKLFRIFSEASKQQYASRADLARAVAAKRYEEFSYLRKGEKQYLTWGVIMEYVALLVSLEMLDDELKPYVQSENVTRRGFELALGEKAEDFANRSGFSAEKVRKAVSDLIARKPAQLPIPATVLAVLQIDCRYQVFYRVMAIRQFQERVNIFMRTKQTVLIPDIFRE